MLPLVTPNAVTETRLTHTENTKQKVRVRMERGATERPDFMSFVLRNQGKEDELTLPEIIPNANTLILAGSETTATLLSGATYLLCKNPGPYSKLVAEIRQSFASNDEINFASVTKLEYTMAVLNESLRLYPPVPNALSRYITDPAGDYVMGERLPYGVSLIVFPQWRNKEFADVVQTKCGISQYAVYTLEANFRDPMIFTPERWTGDPAYENDNRAVFQPFSFGARNCIGRK